jgi:hypothetical protein
MSLKAQKIVDLVAIVGRKESKSRSIPEDQDLGLMIEGMIETRNISLGQEIVVKEIEAEEKEEVIEEIEEETEEIEEIEVTDTGTEIGDMTGTGTEKEIGVEISTEEEILEEKSHLRLQEKMRIADLLDKLLRREEQCLLSGMKRKIGSISLQ